MQKHFYGHQGRFRTFVPQGNHMTQNAFRVSESVKLQSEHIEPQTSIAPHHEQSFTVNIKKISSLPESVVKRTPAEEVRRSIQCLSVFAPEIITCELVEYLDNKLAAADRAISVRSSCSQSQMKMESSEIADIKFEPFAPQQTYKPPQFQKISLEMVKIARRFLGYLTGGQSEPSIGKQSMFIRFCHTFYARLQSCALRLNQETVWVLEEEERRLIPQLLVQTKAKSKRSLINKLVKSIKVLMKVDWESVYLIPEEIMELYLHLRREIIDKTSKQKKLPGKDEKLIARSKVRVQTEDGQSIIEQIKPDGHSIRVGRQSRGGRNPLDAIWDQEKERTLIECSLCCDTYSLIRDYFKVKYPQLKHVVTSDNIRYKIFRTLRQGIRKLVQCYNMMPNQMPPLVSLQDSRMKKLLYYKDCADIKKTILKFYALERLDPIELKQTILAVNQHIAAMEKRMENVSSSQKQKVMDLQRVIATSQTASQIGDLDFWRDSASQKVQNWMDEND